LACLATKAESQSVSGCDVTDHGRCMFQTRTQERLTTLKALARAVAVVDDRQGERKIDDVEMQRRVEKWVDNVLTRTR
jgi:hypothetical protein